jgi:hypothetical protein
MGGRSAVRLEQGRYRELASLPEPVPGDAEAAAQALVWAVRSRMEQGYFRAGVDLARNAPPAVRAAGDAGRALRLWLGFWTLSDTGERPFAEIVGEFRDLCDQLGPAGRAGQAVSALAADLRVRAEVTEFVLRGMGPQHRGPLVTRLAAAADGYRVAGVPREAAGALRRAAAFAVDGLAADREVARELLVRAREEAAGNGLGLAQASAELALAELDFRGLLAAGGDRDLAAALAGFDALTAAFLAGGHAFGDALVTWTVARWLLVYGRPAGLEAARSAARAFADSDVPSSELAVWSALRTWYLVHGDPQQARQAQRRTDQIVRAMGHPLAAEVRVLDEANQAFRSGDVARARTLLAGRSRTAPGMRAASAVMLATSANAVGMRAEARALLEETIADLTAAGASLILGEALAVLSTMLMESDGDRALELLRTAARVAGAAQSPAEEAKYRSQLAWSIVRRRMSAREVPFLDAEAAAEFERAERLLVTERTLEAGGELVRLYQFRGQAAFFGRDWSECGECLTKAETAARAFSLIPDLAFILTYQGLAMMEVARQAGPSAYDQAARLLEQSQVLFRQVELPAFVWTAGFYRALCDIEAVRWPDAGAERGARLDRASALMEAASGVIDQLRESAERGGADRRQQVRMAFSVDKQTFYGQGFQLAWDARSDPGAAWQWLERMKGRALLDGLTDGDDRQKHPARPPARRRLAAVRQSEPPGYEEVRALLAAEEAASGGRRVVVAEYLCTPERTLLLGARADWPVPRAEPVRLDHARLRRFAAGTFRQPGGVRMMMADRGDGGLPEWHQFASLLAPLISWTDPDDVVYLVPHGILHDLPLHTLPLAGVPLLERNPVCYVPAAAVLRHTLRGGEPADGLAAPSLTAAVFGDSRGDLPHARAEAGAVAALLGVTALTGGDVTREQVLRAFLEAGTVHVAGHGRLSTDDGFGSGVDLAGTDVLRAGDLLGARCAARLAVLSGCDTGVSELRPGDEAVGLIRALLLSGVRSIVASQWRVSDASTSELLGGFHRAARDPAVSLADALREAARAVRADPRYTHPYHWGSFAVVGSWR